MPGGRCGGLPAEARQAVRHLPHNHQDAAALKVSNSFDQWATQVIIRLLLVVFSSHSRGRNRVNLEKQLTAQVNCNVAQLHSVVLCAFFSVVLKNMQELVVGFQ